MARLLHWLIGAHRVPLSPAQRWGLAAGGELTEINHGGFDQLWFSFGRRKSREYLSDGWSVDDRRSLQKTRDWLVAVGHRVSCQQLLEHVIAIQAGEEPFDPSSPDASLYPWVNENAMQIQKTGLIAWDFCRLINVARWGYTAAYLDESTAWEWIMQAAKTLQAACSSWQDVANDYRVGFEYWNAGKPPKRSFQAAIERLLTSPTSPWRQLPFDIPLGN